MVVFDVPLISAVKVECCHWSGSGGGMRGLNAYSSSSPGAEGLLLQTPGRRSCAGDLVVVKHMQCVELGKPNFSLGTSFFLFLFPHKTSQLPITFSVYPFRWRCSAASRMRPDLWAAGSHSSSSSLMFEIVAGTEACVCRTAPQPHSVSDSWLVPWAICCSFKLFDSLHY